LIDDTTRPEGAGSLKAARGKSERWRRIVSRRPSSTRISIATAIPRRERGEPVL